jgi:pyrroline-5-carboxylate reductase
MKYRIGFIGAGVMAGIIIERMLESGNFRPDEICAFDVDSGRRQWLQSKNIYVPNNINELIETSDITLLAVKPQNYAGILAEVNTENIKALASIMAGVKISSLKSRINKRIGIARIMPNAPAAIGEGISAVCFDNMSVQDRECIINMLTACGEVIELGEEKFDAFTSLCGSGPAYVYMIMDAMIKGGMNGGLTFVESKTMASATLRGSAAFALQSETPLDIMVQRVCSKGGTTIEAVKIFEEKGLKDIIVEGLDACRKRSIELSESN